MHTVRITQKQGGVVAHAQYSRKCTGLYVPPISCVTRNQGGGNELSGLPVSVCSEKAIIIAYSRGIVMKDTMATSTTKTHDEDGSGK